MDYQSSDLVTLWSELGNLAQNNFNTINVTTEEQILKLDKVYRDVIEYASKNSQTLNVTEKKVSKRQSKIKNPPISVGDLFANEPGFQEPTVTLVRRTTRQASIVAINKMKNWTKSTTLSDDITPHGHPIGNSTVIGNKPSISDNLVEFISPPLFSPENIDKTYIKIQTCDKTYAIPANKEFGNILDKSVDVENVSTSNTAMKKDGKLIQTNHRKREKLEDIDINVDEQVSQHVTRTKKRKIDEDNEVLRVPLEKQISTPLKPVETLTPHQIRENGAEKRKELYLKHKADQKKNDELQIKAAKQREEQIKLNQEKINKKAEEKRKKDEKLKEKELILKAEHLKKLKQAELRKAEIIAKKKLAEEANLLKIQKAEAKLKENELNNPGKSNTIRSKIPSSSTQSFKTATLQKIKTKNVENSKDDYGLNDVSAQDSSEDETGPKRTIPEWAKRENRVLQLQVHAHVDSTKRDLFFDCPKEFNLKKMFKGLSIRDRPRTSSAVWTTPPRYSEYIRRY
ncbi:inner centromere protein A isoform X1 [Adelges cooleyi]|uniref:inner centromere protein A isoform X1 n=1 Tax=Adelges cooleyi TaxID=133065 RepID=UPI00218023D3|nr:inner centromere protein A isoform X1 [Adelges cooleyi]XP_050438720.1 inner centromere protein A isoform X1 [Adelges cooleyi]